jgi:Ser/Thr protein kinase RdoA (MazF antagonist)
MTNRETPGGTHMSTVLTYTRTHATGEFSIVEPTYSTENGWQIVTWPNRADFDADMDDRNNGAEWAERATCSEAFDTESEALASLHSDGASFTLTDNTTGQSWEVVEEQGRPSFASASGVVSGEILPDAFARRLRSGEWQTITP